jgi:hypothetical protein
MNKKSILKNTMIANAASGAVYASTPGTSAGGAAYVANHGPIMTVNIDNKNAWGRNADHRGPYNSAAYDLFSQ